MDPVYIVINYSRYKISLEVHLQKNESGERLEEIKTTNMLIGFISCLTLVFYIEVTIKLDIMLLP